MAPTPGNFIVREATSADIDSMTTIIPRAYPPDAFLNKIFPDTPAIRKWWSQTYHAALDSPAYTLLIAVDGDTVIGALTLHLYRAYSPGLTSYSGICTLVPLTDDHDPVLKEALQGQSSGREESMQQRTNFMIDLMGVDRAYQSRGVGSSLAKRACELADAEDAAIFLETTKAREYYVKLGLGFEARKESVDQEGGGVVVRPAGWKGSEPASS